jgi:hypothetical protein
MEVTVSPGMKHKIPFFVPKSKAIAWQILIKSYDADITVLLREQEVGGAVESELEPKKRVYSDRPIIGGRYVYYIKIN